LISIDKEAGTTLCPLIGYLAKFVCSEGVVYAMKFIVCGVWYEIEATSNFAAVVNKKDV